MTKPYIVKTKCCGTIRKCGSKGAKNKRCLLAGTWITAQKCVHCGWIWDTFPGRDAKPISPREMLEAHS